MKNSRFALLGLLGLFVSTPVLACQGFAFSDPNPKAIAVIEEMKRIGALETQDTVRVKSLWLSVKEGQPDFLFVMPLDQCKGDNCMISGFQPTKKGWFKAYDAFGGNEIRRLHIRNDGYADLVQKENGSVGTVSKTFTWTGLRYEQADTTPVSYNVNE